MHLTFVSAEGGSAFMEELLAVVEDAVAGPGVTTSAHVGAFPPATPDTVYVVVPHEYFVVTPSDLHPTEEQRRRTIAFCVEHPGNDTFEVTVRTTEGLGGAVDINEDSTAELRRRGIAAHPFRLGYSPRWDAWAGSTAPRPVDVTYLGTVDPRRSRILSRLSGDLWSRQARLMIPPHEPMTKTRADFLLAQDKFQHLAASRILLNLHRGDSRSLEWVRVLEAMCNGCVVVTEPSVDLAPLVPGRHLAVGRLESLGLVASALLDDEARLDRMRHEAYDFCRTELSMRSSAATLVSVAEDLVRRHPGTPAANPLAAQPAPPIFRGPWAPITYPTEVATDDARKAAFDTEVLARKAKQDEPVIIHRSGPTANRVAAIVAATDGRHDRDTRISLRAQTLVPAVVGSEGAAVTAGRLRNQLIRSTDSEFVLVAGPTHRFHPTAVEKLVARLDAEPTAAAAYCIVAVEPAGLANVHPFEPERLARTPYLEGPLLLRRSALDEVGGYAEDPALTGLEDHDLLCRLAEWGRTVAFVQEMLVRREEGASDPVRPLDLAPEYSWHLLRSRAPALFAAAGLAPEPLACS